MTWLRRLTPTICAFHLGFSLGGQIDAAKVVFEDLQTLRFLPFNQIDEDPARAELDRRLIIDVLQLPKWLYELDGPMDLLRRKLAHEPQIHDGKKSRVVFSDKTDDSGKTVFEERKINRLDRGSR